MKRIIFSLIAMVMMAVSVNAQNATNYPSKSKFFDNWSIGLKGGVLTPYSEASGNQTAGYFKTISPALGLNLNKEITPWFGVGIDARTILNGEGYPVSREGITEIGKNICDGKTTFDAVNVSANARFNLTHLFFPSNVARRTFEPVVYTGLGWGHTTDEGLSPWTAESQVCQPGGDRNYMTYRAGLELNFNLGKSKAWGVYVDPSIVWGNIRDMRLDKRHSNIELLAGVKYYFKTSNGTHSWALVEPQVVEVEKVNEIVKTVYSEKVITNIVPENVFAVRFALDSAELTDEAKAILNKVPADATVNIAGSTSPEGTSARNTVLAVERANAVAEYLKARGVKINTAEGGDAGRAAVVTIQK